MLFLVLVTLLTQMFFSWVKLFASLEKTSSIFISLLFFILLWYTTKDLVEDIDKFLETDDLKMGVLPLTLSTLLGEGPKDNLSISV